MRLAAALLVASALFAADEKPRPPLDLAAPAAPSATWHDQDLTKADPDELRAEAKSLAYNESLPAEAAQLQHWAIVAKPERGHYSLACFYALAANPDAALYWLQYCGMEGEGADPEWALEDPDLESVRTDPRWKPVHGYLTACAAWWEKNGAPRTIVTLPEGYAKGTAIPALIGLHGLGSMPDDFAGGDDYQQLANRLGAAVIGASGTRCLGKRIFCWSEDPDRDLARVKAALDEAKDRVTIRPGAVVLIGFSQGAQMAAELASRGPETFAGAIALCPGAKKGSMLSSIAKPSPLLAARTFVVIDGEAEDEGNLAMGIADAEWLTARGALVLRHLYPGMGHSFPPDALDNFEIWTRLVLAARDRAAK